MIKYIRPLTVAYSKLRTWFSTISLIEVFHRLTQVGHFRTTSFKKRWKIRFCKFFSSFRGRVYANACDTKKLTTQYFVHYFTLMHAILIIKSTIATIFHFNFLTLLAPYTFEYFQIFSVFTQFLSFTLVPFSSIIRTNDTTRIGTSVKP